MTTPRPSASPPVVRLGAFYWFYFAALGAVVPYLGPYLEWLGFSPAAIGELLAIATGTRIAAPLLMGWLCDRTAVRMRWVRWASVATAIAFVGMWGGDGYGWLALVIGGFSFFWAAALPPVEAVTLDYLGDQSGRYARIRLWGSAGFIAAVALGGAIFDGHGLGWFPALCLVLLAPIAPAAWLVPEHPVAPHADAPISAVLRRPDVLAFFALAVLVQASHGPYYVFFTIHLEKVGFSKAAAGPLWGLGVVAEIAIFLVMHRLLGRFGALRLLALALGLTAARWVLIGYFAAHLPTLLFAQLLHAASFGLFHAASIALIHRLFVGAHQARGQALYSSLCYGLGGAAGSLYAGYAWTWLGPKLTFAAAAAAPLIGLLLAVIYLRQPEPGRPVTPPAPR